MFMRACVLTSDSLLPQGLQPPQALLSLKLSRQEYWSQLPFPPSDSSAVNIISLSSECK